MARPARSKSPRSFAARASGRSLTCAAFPRAAFICMSGQSGWRSGCRTSRGASYEWRRGWGDFAEPAGSPNVALRHPSFRGYADYMQTPAVRPRARCSIKGRRAVTRPPLCAPRPSGGDVTVVSSPTLSSCFTASTFATSCTRALLWSIASRRACACLTTASYSTISKIAERSRSDPGRRRA